MYFYWFHNNNLNLLYKNDPDENYLSPRLTTDCIKLGFLSHLVISSWDHLLYSWSWVYYVIVPETFWDSSLIRFIDPQVKTSFETCHQLVSRTGRCETMQKLDSITCATIVRFWCKLFMGRGLLAPLSFQIRCDDLPFSYDTVSASFQSCIYTVTNITGSVTIKI